MAGVAARGYSLGAAPEAPLSRTAQNGSSRAKPSQSSHPTSARSRDSSTPPPRQARFSPGIHLQQAKYAIAPSPPVPRVAPHSSPATPDDQPCHRDAVALLYVSPRRATSALS